MSAPQQTFHPFQRLPLELREQIWRYCLPYRVRELDTPLSDNVYWSQPQLCQLQNTSGSNSLPPLIAQVCYESRKVAHETGVSLVENAESASPEWYAATGIYTTWQDPLRESLHLNWARIYAVDIHSKGHPLEYLVRIDQDASGSISLTSEYLYQSATKAQDLELLKKRASWLVVVRTIVIHSDIRFAAATGLFGLLGDSRVQVFDVGDMETIKRYINLAESRECEQGPDITAKQDFRLETVWTQAELLREYVWENYGEDMTTRLHPAVMFRLCTQMCNHREVQAAQEAVRRQPMSPPRPRGRGRGTVRGGCLARYARVDDAMKAIWRRMRS